jgi:helicase SWR1
MASINATKAPERGPQRKGKQKGRVHGRKGLLTEERIAAERTALLAERQVELESVLDTHDTLVSVRIFESVLYLTLAVASRVVSN